MATVEFEIKSYALELGTRAQGIDNDRAIVPFHQLVLRGIGTGGAITVVMEFWFGIEKLSPTGPAEIGSYDPTRRHATIQAAIIDFMNTYEVLRTEKAVNCSFTHSDSGLPSSRAIMSSALSTKAQPLGGGPVARS